MKPRAILCILSSLVLGASFLTAHPMGNFSVSHYAKFDRSGPALRLTYALDLAEIPTSELLREWKLERTSPRAELDARALEQARQWVSGLKILADGQAVSARVQGADLVIADGEGNLPLLRITARVELGKAEAGRIEYEDGNYADRAGWKEIVIAGKGIAKSSHSPKDISKALSAYPEDPAVVPPRDLRARFEWAPESPKPVVIEPIPQPAQVMPPAQPGTLPDVASARPGVVPKGDFLSELLRKGDLSLGMIVFGLGAAFVFGAMHALSPGHGKTIVAAYLVGSHGTFQHAILLGAMVTITHTASVFALGLGTLFLSRYIVPDKIYPILATISGLMIVFIGASLFYKRLNALLPHLDQRHHHHHDHDHHHHDHDHEHAAVHAQAHASASHSRGHAHNGHGHDHSHDHGHDHHHGPGGHTHNVEGEVTMSNLIGLAVSGGLVPCPSALVLLLSAIAIGRIGLGMALLASFSLGLSLVLIAIGAAVLYAKHLLPDRASAARSPFVRMMPVISAAVITIVGMLMTAAALGWIKPLPGLA